MSNFNTHRIKRRERKEAWYGDSYNPFRTVRRSNIRGDSEGMRDEEARVERDTEDRVPLSRDNSFPRESENNVAVVERTDSRPTEEEEKGRQRFASKFFKRGTEGYTTSGSENEGPVRLGFVTCASGLTSELEYESEEPTWDPFGAWSEIMNQWSYKANSPFLPDPEGQLAKEWIKYPLELSMLTGVNRFVDRGFSTAITTPRGAAKSNFKFPKIGMHVIDVVG